MKKLTLGLLLLGGSLVACAPAQGVRPLLYKASSAQILATIGQIAPSIQPSRVTNYFSVQGITPTVVTLQATPVTGMQIVNVLGGNRMNTGSIIVNFTALENNGVTSLTHSTNNASATPEFIGRIYAELDKQFQRIPNP